MAGAGVAGLAAAWRLSRAGVAVTLLESAARAGGRAACVDAHRVLPTDASLHELVEASGSAPALLPLRYLARAHATEGGWVGADRPGWSGVAKLPGVGPLAALRLARLPRLLRRWRDLLDPARPERAAPLDDRSLADFGRLYFGTGAVAGWMEPLLAETAPVQEEKASRAHFLLRHTREAWSLPGSFRAPAGRMAEALASRLGARYETALEAAEPLPSQRLALRLRSADGEEVREADALVLAVPADEALRIASPLLVAAERRVLGAVHYACSITWVAELPRTPVGVATRVRVPRALGSPIASVTLEPRLGPDGTARGARATLVTRDPWAREHRDASDDAIAKELAAHLARWTHAGTEEPRSPSVQRHPRAWPDFAVGRYRALARLRRVLADRRAAGRRLYLAGDWTAGPTLEDAAWSGVRAASDLLRDLGASRSSGTTASRPAP